MSVCHLAGSSCVSFVPQVRVEKIKKRINLYIDNKNVKKVKGPRKVNVGRELFLGGLPLGVMAPKVDNWQVLFTNHRVLLLTEMCNHPKITPVSS